MTNPQPKLRNGKSQATYDYEKIGTFDRQKQNHEYQRISTQIQAGAVVIMPSGEKHEHSSRWHAAPVQNEVPEMPRYVTLPTSEKYPTEKLHEFSLSQYKLLETDPYEELPDSPNPLKIQKKHQSDSSDVYEKLVLRV